MKKKKNISISSPDDLNKNLQYSSPVTGIVLSLIIFLLAGLFVWASIYKIKFKLTGMANVSAGQVTLIDFEASSLEKLEAGQKIYISGIEGEILSIEDNQITFSSFPLEDADYPYYIVLREAKPIDFLLK